MEHMVWDFIPSNAKNFWEKILTKNGQSRVGGCVSDWRDGLVVSGF